MPRVNYVKKARKDNPAVKKGESYYWWKFRYGGKHYSRNRPRPSQLTQSAYLSQVRGLIEMIEDNSTETWDDFDSLREEVKSELDNIRDECQSNLDNMPDQLQYAPVGELLQERINALESAESDIDYIDEFNEDEPTLGDFDDNDEFENAYDEWQTNLNCHVDNAKQEMIDCVSNCDL